MQTTIFLKNLVVPCRVGVLEKERYIRQPVQFTVEITLHGDDAPQQLEHSVCYAALSEHIKTLCAVHTDLVETLAADIMLYCLAKPAAASATVTVEKLTAIKGAASAGCTITARKSHDMPYVI